MRLPNRVARRIGVVAVWLSAELFAPRTAPVAAGKRFFKVERGAPGSSNAVDWVARAERALGGDEKLRSLDAVEISGISVWHQREQSERPEGPWFATFTDFTDTRYLRADVVKRTARNRGFTTPDWVDNKDWTDPATMFVASDVGLRPANGTFVGAEKPFDLGTLPLELGPERILVAARDAGDLRVEPDAVADGYTHHVIAFTSSAGARLRVFLNVPSFLPKAVEITRARPYDVFWAPWGDVTQRITFGLWTLEPEGVLYPRLWDFSTSGQPDGTLEITRVRINPSIDPSELSVPDDARERVIAGRRAIADLPFGTPQKPAREIAPGVVQVPGSWNVVEIKQDDGAVILEGPLSSHYAAMTIEDARRRFEGAPIKAVISTSDSWPHIGGMREYVAQRIPIYALDLNIPILQRLFAAKYESSPDALMNHPTPPVLHLVSAKTVIGAGLNQLAVYPLRTASGERQMMVYWPAQRLLYTSDLFTLRDKFVFLPQQVAEAVEAVARENLQVTTAFGMHYDPVPWSDVVAAAAPPGRAAH
jgi:hypothetical protein